MDKFPVGFFLICGGFFFVVTLAVGTGLILLSRRNKKKAEISQSWPTTGGKVVLSEIRESTSTDDDGYTSTTFFPRVEFSYTVAGQIYESKKLSFGGVMANSNPAKAQETIDKYPVGSSVTVYYNPEKPSEGVIERTAGPSNLLMIIGGILLGISSIFACLLLVAVVRNFL